MAALEEAIRGMKSDEGNGLKELEVENRRLKELLAESELDKRILKEALEENYRPARRREAVLHVQPTRRRSVGLVPCWGSLAALPALRDNDEGR
ncbi:MAG: hypothetical protein R3B91_09080 [Planctomycetaceae bacterium]